MAVDSCAAFLQAAYEDPHLWRHMKALTGVAEIIRLGDRHGYQFDERDLAAASATATHGPASTPKPAPRSGNAALGLTHHEYDMDKLPGFEAVIAELPHLKIQPPTVDLTRFGETFREDDLRSTAMIPASPEHRSWQAAARREHTERRERVAPQGKRDFHLINLDDHVDHPGYDDYLAAKTRVIGALEDVFGDEIRFSGSMWYPPSGYRLWHTNKDQPGWRMYLIDFDDDFTDPEQTSFFRYRHPESGELVTLKERPRLVRFFKIEQDPARLFWHCIVNPTQRHRWSFGFVVPDAWLDAITARS